MDVKQAKAYLEDFIEYAGNDGIGVPSREPYDLAIQALEKQISMEVKDLEIDELGTKFYTCPSCEEMRMDGRRCYTNYCPNCGQKIKFGDVN